MIRQTIKKLIILMTALTLGQTAYSKTNSIKITFQTNKIHCLFNFIDAISGSNYGSSVLKNYYDKSKYNTPENQKLLNEYSQLDLYNGISYSEFPVSRRMGRNIFEMFIIQSAYSKNLDDFSQRTFGLLPYNQHLHLFELLKKFEPIYEQLIWREFSTDTYRIVKEFELLAQKNDLTTMFSKAKKFYQSSWPDPIPFVVSIYPIPTDGNAKATPMGNVETVGVYAKETNLSVPFSSMFHEMCHSIYESQSLETQNEIENYFSGKDRFSFYAYQYLNEGLATCIGNGWAYYKITGKLDTASWHSNPYYSDYAKALYPLVKNYLETDKAMDSVFYKKAADIFKVTFPTAIYEYNNLFSSTSMYCDGVTFMSKNVKKTVRQYFKLNQLDSYTPISSEIDLKTISNTVLVFVSNEQGNQLSALIKRSPMLLNNRTELMNKNNFVFTALDAEQRAFIIFKADKIEIVSALLDKIKKQKLINLNEQFIFQ